MISRTPKIMPYKYILFLVMLFVTVDLAAVSVAYKLVSFDFIFKINSGATFIFPLTYALGDIITEVYGYNMARKLIWLSLLLQFIFAILVTIVIHLPKPYFWNGDSAYVEVFGSTLRFVLAGTVANVISNFLNVYIVSKLKIPFEGKLFWVRSILSTLISGFILVTIILGMGFLGKSVDTTQFFVMFKSTYYLEVFYALILVMPSALIATYLKHAEKIDVYDYDTNFNPFNFKFLSTTTENIHNSINHALPRA